MKSSLPGITNVSQGGEQDEILRGNFSRRLRSKLDRGSPWRYSRVLRWFHKGDNCSPRKPVFREVRRALTLHFRKSDPLVVICSRGHEPSQSPVVLAPLDPHFLGSSPIWEDKVGCFRTLFKTKRSRPKKMRPSGQEGGCLFLSPHGAWPHLTTS